MTRTTWVAAGAVAVVVGVLVGGRLATPPEPPDARLVSELASLTERARDLRAEVVALEEEVDGLRAEGDAEGAALAEAERRLAALQVLAAVVPAEGAGVVLTVTDPAGAVSYGLLLDVVQELRDAGAEAVAVNGARVGPASAFEPLPGGVVLDGAALAPPYVVEAVGDPHALERGLAIPGGARDVLVARDRVTVDVARRDHVWLAPVVDRSSPRSRPVASGP